MEPKFKMSIDIEREGSPGLTTGFTLIELMIVIVIVGLLAAFAYPSYLSYVRDAQRSYAKLGLLDTAQRLERCYTMQNDYGECSIDKDHFTDRGYWRIHFEVARQDGQGYTLTAYKTSKGVTDRVCSGKMLFDETGRREPADECW